MPADRVAEDVEATSRMKPEKFCLSWNDFEKNIGVAFRELREAKDFFDLTLVCEDEQIQAHKVVLSACSPFFRDILRRNPHQHPLLYLKGVKCADLEAVLKFMYQGEVNVVQEELNSFLALAEDLHVKGLTQAPSSRTTKSEPESELRTKRTSPQRSETSSEPLSKKTRLSSSQDAEILPIKSEKVASTASVTYTNSKNKSSVTGTEVSVGDYSEDYDDINDDYPDQLYNPLSADLYKSPSSGIKGSGVPGQRPDLSECFEKLVDGQGMAYYSCLLCGKTCSRKDSLLTHIENIHFPGGYACQFCELIFNSQNTLAVHMRRKHNTSLSLSSSQSATAAAAAVVVAADGAAEEASALWS